MKFNNDFKQLFTVEVFASHAGAQNVTYYSS